MKVIFSSISIIIQILFIISLQCNVLLINCKKSPSSHRSSSSSSSSSSSARNRKKPSGPVPKSIPRYEYEDEEDDYLDDMEDEMEDEIEDEIEVEEEDDYADEEIFSAEDEYEEEILPPPKQSRKSRQPLQQSPRSRKGSNRSPPPPNRRRRYDDDDFEEPRSSRRGSPQSRSQRQRGGVVPYTSKRRPPPSQSGMTETLTKGMAFLRDSMPSPTSLRDTTASYINSAKERTTQLSKDIYREVKGLTSSELEQVMLKSTKPDDSPVKSKHVERLVGVTYQISGRYDIYDAVLRKLWSKMAEEDWRTKIKALYILHRFSADGAPDHQAALKARLRELRRTPDPKRRGSNYFSSKVLLLGTNSQPAQPYRSFLTRYAHYVLLRAQCFSGLFQEISSSQSKKKSKSSSSSSDPLKLEHLEAAQLLLKAACACEFKSKVEECENTCIALERVAVDLMGLTSAVATALSRGLSSIDESTALLKRWCLFYSEELRPQTKAFVKKASGTLDQYSLFLPSRMSASVSQELLQKGLAFQEQEGNEDTKGEEEEEEVVEDVEQEEAMEEEVEEEEEGIVEEEEDEYEYEDEYDDE